MGYFAPYASQKPKLIRRAKPRMSGTRTWADFHGYCIGKLAGSGNAAQEDASIQL